MALWNTLGETGAVGYVPPMVRMMSPYTIVKYDVDKDEIVRDSKGFAIKCNYDEVRAATRVPCARTNSAAARRVARADQPRRDHARLWRLHGPSGLAEESAKQCVEAGRHLLQNGRPRALEQCTYARGCTALALAFSSLMHSAASSTSTTASVTRSDGRAKMSRRAKWSKCSTRSRVCARPRCTACKCHTARVVLVWRTW